jgi:hypothetical protein
MHSDREYVVLVSHWNHQWDVFILDPATGLIGTTTAASLGGVELAARLYLNQQFATEPHRFKLTVIQS